MTETIKATLPLCTSEKPWRWINSGPSHNPRRDEGRIGHGAEHHDAERVPHGEQRAELAQRLAHRFLRSRVLTRRLAHPAPDRKPGQYGSDRQHDEAHAPRALLNQPREWCAGRQHAHAADGEHQARDRRETRCRKVPRNEDRAHQECRRAADADQHLPRHQHAVTGRHCGEDRAGDRQRKRRQHRAANAMQVDADAHEELHGAEGEMECPRKNAERLRREPELVLQRTRHDGADRAKSLA